MKDWLLGTIAAPVIEAGAFARARSDALPPRPERLTATIRAATIAITHPATSGHFVPHLGDSRNPLFQPVEGADMRAVSLGEGLARPAGFEPAAFGSGGQRPKR